MANEAVLTCFESSTVVVITAAVFAAPPLEMITESVAVKLSAADEPFSLASWVGFRYRSLHQKHFFGNYRNGCSIGRKKESFFHHQGLLETHGLALL